MNLTYFDVQKESFFLFLIRRCLNFILISPDLQVGKWKPQKIGL